MRVLYSFGHVLGAAGIGYAAAQQITSLSRLGCDVTVIAASSRAIAFPPDVRLIKTFQWGRFRAPVSLVGQKRLFTLHDRIVARTIRFDRKGYDVVHTWPGCCYFSLRAAKARGTLAVREAPNTHTQYAMEVVEREHQKLGVPLTGTHARDDDRIKAEAREYAIADLVLAPSEFAVETFVERGVAADRLAIKRYGFDPDRYDIEPQRNRGSLVTFAFVASCEPRKGLHYALDAWHKSKISDKSKFIIVGRFSEGYREALAEKLNHPNVEIRGFVSDLKPIYEAADVLVLPSIEEGSALVTYDAQGAGCALLVSRAAGAWMTDGVEGLQHDPGDVDVLVGQMRRLVLEPDLRRRMQHAAYQNSKMLTWDAATSDLRRIYKLFRRNIG
ncbi:glycosyltransferase [Rhodobacterales bacterium HKCCE3408]|nr:glycosyltransferase [Rhodobacterales bacterium HKCCE3408]